MKLVRIAAVRSITGACAVAAVIAACDRRDDRTVAERFAALASTAPVPVYGTDRPLDSARIETVLADSLRIQAAVAPGDRRALATSADAARLGWLWRIVGKLDDTVDADWVAEAGGLIEATAADYRNWPVRGATGPATEAALLERVPESEIMAIAARRAEVGAFFDALAASGAGADLQTIKASDPEALAWLLQPGGRVELAGDRFDSASEAADFVRALYAAGATKVVIASESIHEAPETKESAADALRIELPGDRAQRAALFRMVNEEVQHDGFAPERDEGQSVLYMWWD